MKAAIVCKPKSLTLGEVAVAPRTVAFHKYRMMEQLRIKTNAELIQFAVRQHLV